MFIGPFKHHDQCAPRQFPLDNRQCLNVDQRFILGIDGMKMRRIVLAPDVHVNQYAEELADGWHGLLFIVVENRVK